MALANASRQPHRPQPHWRCLAQVDLHVADLGPVAVLAFEHLVVEDDAAADAGAEREHHHALDVAAGADPVLAEGGRVGIVLKRGRHAETWC